MVESRHPGPIPPGDPVLWRNFAIHQCVEGMDSLGRGGPYEII